MRAWHEEPINKNHDRGAFDCGEEALNELLRRYARKSHEMGGAKTFLAIDDADNKTILGFYSQSEPRFGRLCPHAGDRAGEGWLACRTGFPVGAFGR